MQYGVKVNSYKRISPDKTKTKEKVKVNLSLDIICIIFGILISRVYIPVSTTISLAPFGVAYYLAISDMKKNKVNLFYLVAILLGYISNYNDVSNSIVYIGISILIFLLSNIKLEFKSGIKSILFMIVTFASIFMYDFIFTDIALSYLLFYSSIKGLSILPLYYIFKHSISCVDNTGLNLELKKEDIISFCIMISFVVIGLGNYSIYGLNFQVIMSLFIVLVLSYIMGPSIGAAFGVCMGFISGIAGSDMILYISLYSMCGLIGGVFKDSGKLFTSIAYILVFIIIYIYSDKFMVTSMIEISIVVAMFMLTPRSIIEAIHKQFTNEEKVEIAQEIELKGMKDEFKRKVESLKGVLTTMSSSISSLSENDKLLLKNKESALVESLADRVCVNCNKKNKCWKSDIHSTYSLFTDSIRNFENGNEHLPLELDKRCKNKYRLIKDIKDIVTIQKTKEAAKNRLIEGRILISNHMNSMSFKLAEMMNEFERDMNDCINIDKILKKSCKRKSIRFENIYSYLDNNERLKIKVVLKKEDGERYCLDNIIPMIKRFVNIPLSISQNSIYIDNKAGLWEGIVEESPRYLVKSYSSVQVKEGEEFSGDNYYFGECNSNKYISILSDGMGSGVSAGVESKVCIDLIKKYLESGFTIDTAVDVVNSIMAMKFDEDEKFATLDYYDLDLYSGELTSIKFGGVLSFVKKGNTVEEIKSDSLPFGIIDNLEVNKVKTVVNEGDIIVNITDGVIDFNKDNIGKYLWLKEFLEGYDGNIENLADSIIEKAKEFTDGKVYDDMTVVVSKVYSMY